MILTRSQLWWGTSVSTHPPEVAYVQDPQQWQETEASIKVPFCYKQVIAIVPARHGSQQPLKENTLGNGLALIKRSKSPTL